MEFEARLDQSVRDANGKPVGTKTQRTHLEEAVRQGGPGATVALRALANPNTYPGPLRYLHDWSLELYGRSGFSELGMNGLTWQALDAWARRTGRNPTPAEADGLFAIDTAVRAAGSG